MPTHDRRRTLRSGLLRVVVASAGVAFIIAHRQTFTEALTGLRHTSPGLVLAGVVLSFAGMVNRGLLNRAAHHAVGLTPTPLAMTRTTAVGFAVNKVLRSGGASGLTVFLRHGKRRGFRGDQVTAACVVASITSLLALGVLLTTAVTVLAMSGRLTGWWLAASAGFALYGLALGTAGRTALRNEHSLTRAWTLAQRLRNRITRRDTPIDTHGVHQFAAALDLARTNTYWARRGLSHAVVSKALGAAMLLVAAAAAGLPISPAEALVIYATALAASFASIIPAGVGVVEASTGAMFIAAGAPASIAVVAVALYRCFDLWLPVATGAALGRRELRTQPASEPAPTKRRPAQANQLTTA